MRLWAVLCFLVIFTDFARSQDVTEATLNILKDGEKKMSEHILKILEHYKQPEPEWIQGLNIPEPIPLPDTMSTVFSINIYFKNITLYGLNKFKIISFNLDLESMEVNVVILFNKLHARSSYNYYLFYWDNSDLFTGDLLQVRINARGILEVRNNGKLHLKDIQVDANPKDIKVHFQNMPMIFQSANEISKLFFDLVKPYMFDVANKYARSEIDKRLEEVMGDMLFPNSVSPLDISIAEMRKTLKQNYIEPFKIKDFNSSLNLFSIALSHMYVTGLTSFYRVGKITLKTENNTVIADFEIGTQKLAGTSLWTVTGVGGFLSTSGTFSFSVDYINGRVVLAQPLDTRKTPHLKDLQLEIGNIQVLTNGAGTIDYLIEFAANILPNLLRNQIIRGLEEPIKEKLQLELNSINVEELINQTLPKVDQIQKTGLKLSTAEIETEEDDNFFNF